MGLHAHVLKNWKDHDPKKVFLDSAAATFGMGAMFYYQNDRQYFSDGRLKFTYLTIVDDVGFIKDNNDCQLIFNIQGVNLEDISLGLDKDFDHLRPNESYVALHILKR